MNSAIAGHFSFFRHYATYWEKGKFSICFSETIFEKHFSQFLVFEEFCEGKRFSSLKGDFFITFDHVELMSFLIDLGKNLISVFLNLCVFPKF